MVSLDSLLGDDAAVLDDRNFRLLLLANIPPVVGTALLSPVLDSLIEPFGTTAANVGLMISLFTAPGIVIVPVAGVLADRYGRKPILVTALLLFGLTGTAIAFTTDFRVALGLRLLQGIGFAGIVPTLITSIGDLYAGSREAMAQGLRFTVSGLSQAAFPLLAGVLVAAAWQYPFLLYAVAFPIAAFVYVGFDEPTAVDSTTEAADGGTEQSYSRALVGLVRRPRVLSLVVGRTLPVVVWIAFLTYNSIIVVQLIDGTPVQAGLLTAVGSVSFAAAASQAGRITGLFASRFYPLLGANACLAVGLAGVLFAPGIVVASVAILVTGVGFGLTLSLYRSIITGLAPQSLRAGLVSLAEAGGRVTATLTPIAMGAVIAVAAPAIGFTQAVQVAGLGAAAVGGGGGVLCLVVARLSSAAPAERAG
ncbi:MFS transporter [Halorientalis litorea]|uniref:MFS transporter n=1 Tax=Halorientalis litorea TaxID=2931977 RepID=UPI001FF4A4C1|nr:MFS transporter [Halorientalis litorea]